VHGLDGLALKDGSEVLACPWCFGDDHGEIDADRVRKVLTDNWDRYGEHFTNPSPPDSDITLPPLRHGHFESG
jgi:hypothetical protein